MDRVEGVLAIGGGRLEISAGGIARGKPGRFHVVAKDFRYGTIQEAIDPDVTVALKGRVNVDVTGRIGIAPYVLDGDYRITSDRLTLVLSEMLDPYLPLEFRASA